MYYDPMIAKLITYGSDRASAAKRMQRALDEFLIKGVQHNIAFLNALMSHPRFLEGRLTTNFIAEEYPDGFNPTDTVPADTHVFCSRCRHARSLSIPRRANFRSAKWS